MTIVIAAPDTRRSLVAIERHHKTVAVEQSDGWFVTLFDATETLGDFAIYATTSVNLDVCNEYAIKHGWPAVLLAVTP